MSPYPEGVRAFVQAHLIARPGGRVSVAYAYHEFGAFQRRRNDPEMTLASFGAALTRMAESVGGRRDGSAVTGLIWKENDDALTPALRADEAGR